MVKLLTLFPLLLTTLVTFVVSTKEFTIGHTLRGSPVPEHDRELLFKRLRMRNVCFEAAPSVYTTLRVNILESEQMLQDSNGVVGDCLDVCDQVCDGAENVQEASSNRCVCNEFFYDHAAAVDCGPNQKQVEADGNGALECDCEDGFVWRAGACIQDVCPATQCSVNTVCATLSEGQAQCFCLPGYMNFPGFGCIRIPFYNQCRTILCAPNARCERTGLIFGDATCECMNGFIKDANGACVEDDICSRVRCDSNSVCVPSGDGTGATCECIDGFHRDEEGRCSLGCPPLYVKDENGLCIEDFCARVRCAYGTQCVNLPGGGASCECLPGLVREDNGVGCVEP